MARQRTLTLRALTLPFGSAALIAVSLGSAAQAQTAAPAPTTTPAASTTTAPAQPAATASSAAPAGEPEPLSRDLPPAGIYTFDPQHSQVVFEYSHQGLSNSHGTVNGVTGTITIDRDNPANSSVEAQFPLSAIQLIDPELQEQLLGEGFFAGLTPETQVTFTSTLVQLGDDDEADVTGDLTMNGVTRPVTLEVEYNGMGEHPETGAPKIGFSIDGSVRRSEFNLGVALPAVEDELDLEIAVEASPAQ